ncbi:MAG: sensor histidine kinase [Faecalibacterium sp.]
MQKTKASQSNHPMYRVPFNSLWIIISALTVVLSLSAVITISFFINRNADYAINTSIEENNRQVAENVALEIDSYIEELVTISNGVNLLLQKGEVESLTQDIFALLRDDIETILVLNSDGEIIYASEDDKLRSDITTESLFVGISVREDGYMLSAPHVQRIYEGEYPWVITLTQGISWVEGDTIQNGIIVVDMNFSTIRELCTRELQNEGYLYIADAAGNLIYHPNQQMVYAGISSDNIIFSTDIESGAGVVQVEESDLSIYVQPLESFGWSVVGVAQRDGLSTYSANLGYYIIAAVLALAVLLIVGSLLISMMVVSPLYKLMHVMDSAWAEDELPKAPKTKLYEVARLGSAFDTMVERINSLVQQVKEEQTMLRKSELKTLTNQMNPHFLYNTLESVVWLAEAGEQKNVIQMITALSKYFRLSLSGAREFISVADEMAQIENYLIIEKMRFGDVFRYEISYPEEIEAIRTPKIMLQPFVENALVHGLSNMDDDGLISITAQCDGTDLLFVVRDNGQGMKEEQLARILVSNPKSKSGVGIKNVNQRLHLLYGDAYGVQVESQLDEGTTVSIRLPIHPEGRDML